MSTLTELTETRMSRVKQSLSDWREVVIRTDSVLSWEQDWYPAVIASVVTAFYLFVWYWDPTLITFIAFTGLFLTLADYLGPKIINQVCGSDTWTGAKEKKYDQVCEDIVSAWDHLEGAWTLCREARSRKPVFHFVATIMALFSMAWIGNSVNNFVLAYTITNAVFMMPGLQQRGHLKQYGAQLTLKIAELVKGKDYMKKAE